MQTFLPYPGFAESAAVLDDRRLGKQRVETLQVLRAVVWPVYGWKNHPATRMWRGFVPALVSYGAATCDEWVRRGRADAVRAQLAAFTGGRVLPWEVLREDGMLPPWLGVDEVHRSHRSALLRKDPVHYGRWAGEVPDDLPYVWPAAAFPRWPVRRGGPDPLPVDDALALLGLDAAREEQRLAALGVRAGADVTLRLPRGGGLTTAGLLAALCTRGTTVWRRPGRQPRALSAAAVQALRDGRGAVAPVIASAVSESVARSPGVGDLEAMAAEAAALGSPEIRFGAGPPAGVAPPGCGLLVLEGTAGVLPGPNRDRWPVPVLRLVADGRADPS